MEAKLAADTSADALSVGCELEGTSAAQEARWRSLIADVSRLVYDHATREGRPSAARGSE